MFNVIKSKMNNIKDKFSIVKDNITDTDVWLEFLNDIKWWLIGGVSIILGIIWIYFSILDFKCDMKAKAINHSGEYSWWMDECVFAKGDDKFLLRQIKRISVEGDGEEDFNPL